MAIALDCPCGASLRLPTALAGHVGRCPGCGLPLRAPDEVREPAPVVAPPPVVVAPPPAPAPPPVDVAPAPVVAPPPVAVPPAPARPPGPAPALPRIVRVECECRRLVVAPGAQVAAGTARCPTCDRRLEVRRVQP